MLHLVREVDVFRGDAGDGGLDAGDAAEGLRYQVVAQDPDRAAARRVVPGSGQRELDRPRPAVGAAVERERRVGDPAGDRERLEALDLSLRRRLPVARPGHDHDRRRGGSGEVGSDPRQRGQGRLVLRGQRLVARLRDVQPESRHGERNGVRDPQAIYTLGAHKLDDVLDWMGASNGGPALADLAHLGTTTAVSGI